ncbi:MAG: N-acetylglucosamine kinase [Terriglobia bacterium]
MNMNRIVREEDVAYFLGIDGGGSGTASWLADDRNRILARATAGPSNPIKVGIDLAGRHIVEAARLALRKAGFGRIVLDAVCAGVAGAGRPGIDRQLLACLRRGLRARHYILTTDGIIALECALGKSPGIVVISGTGSIAYGRDASQHVFRCGGWGSVFDDPGSGYDIGRRAVAAALRGFDGRGPSTRLNRDICQALKIKEITQVVEKPLAPDDIAALFPAVLRAARRGDPVAKQLCRDAGSGLAEMAAAILKRMGGLADGRRVVCAGGVFKASSSVRRSFAIHLHRSAPGAKITLLRRAPVQGALSLARAFLRYNGQS